MSEAKKLRALVPACDDPSDYTEDDRVMLACADHIEALEAERDSLLHSLKVTDGLARDWEARATEAEADWVHKERANAAIEAAEQRAEALEAERDRLREVVRQVVERSTAAGGMGVDDDMLEEMARAALSPTPER